MKHLKYFRWLMNHKWRVFVECYKLGVLWRGIMHDMSKFRSDEWRFYAEWYWGDRKNVSQDDFDSAWMRHQNRNPHHWQFWVFIHDDGREDIAAMGDAYRREMLADWRALSGDNAAIRDARLHPNTHKWIEEQLMLDKLDKSEKWITRKQILGLAFLTSPFIALLVYEYINHGTQGAIMVFASCAIALMLYAILFVGVRLLVK